MTDKTDIRLSVRMTRAERDALKERAGSDGISGFVRRQLFGKRAARRSTQPTKPKIAEILGKLGASGALASLKALSEAARHGTLELDEEQEKHIEIACSDVAEIKSLLMKALRIKED